jgi:hypothetical protein
MVVVDTGCEDVNWTHMIQERIQQHAIVDLTLNIQGP